MNRALPTLLSATLIVAVVAGHARAQSVEAETLFVEGEKHMAAGQYDKACEAFSASNRLEARAGTLINLGLCEEKRERYASAWLAFRESLTRVKDPVKKQVADEHIADLQARLSYLTIEVPGSSKLDGLVVTRDGQTVDPALYGRGIPVDGGTHRVTARAPGTRQWISEVTVAKEGDRPTVIVPSLAAETAQGPSGPAPAPAPAVRRAGGNRHTGLVIAFGAVGVAGLATGIWGATTASSLDRDASALCPDPGAACAKASEANELLDRRDRRALVANVGFGVAAVGVIAAGIAWFTGRTSPSVDVAVAVTRDGANFTVGASF